ncbi:MAG TPA: VOC family protein [Candidatus Baltobacteraceae bacterium]|nr:VOC family protein [Candidatus Baltobacteraceae bacterium]
MHVGIVTVYVADQDRAKKFYTEQLGWDVRDDQPMGPDMRWLAVVPKGAQTAVVLCKGFGDWTPEKVGGHQGIALEVDDVFKEAEALKKNGVEFAEEPSVQYFGGWASFKDSEGNIIGMHSPVPVGAQQQ